MDTNKEQVKDLQEKIIKNKNKAIIALCTLLVFTLFVIFAHIYNSKHISYYKNIGVHDCVFSSTDSIRIILKDRQNGDYTDAFYVDKSENGKLVQASILIDKLTGNLMFGILEPAIYVKQVKRYVEQEGVLTMDYGKGTCSYLSTVDPAKEKTGKIVIGDY